MRVHVTLFGNLVYILTSIYVTFLLKSDEVQLLWQLLLQATLVYFC